ncbi:sugar-binding domain-containing protein [Salana multivorans]
MSNQAGGNAHAIFAPLVLDDAETAAALRRQPDIARAMAYFDRVGVAVVAVGSWDPPISQLHESLSESQREELAAQDVVAEIVGILVTPTGELVSRFADRWLSITAEQLSRVPKVIAVAAEAEKAAALHAVTRSGLISSLVTERRCAEALLDLPRIEQGIDRSEGDD